MFLYPYSMRFLAASVLVCSTCAATAGSYLNLVQYPAGSGFQGPAPNVIITVDNSGSMGDVGMNALRSALRETFRPENVPDGSIRLAYQSLNGCNTIPHAAPGCDNQNYMQKMVGNFDEAEGSPRGRFLRWLNTLASLDSTPTLDAVRGAGEYLKLTGANSPWNAVPGKADSQPLACRKAYHVLMTDGGWNTWYGLPTIDGDSRKTAIYNNTIDNVDGTAKTLPDGKLYDPASPQSRVYADPWGRQATDGGGPGMYWQGDNGVSYWSESSCTANTKNCKYINDLDWRDVAPSVSDLAFHYWSTDLQPGIDNKVPAKITHKGDETLSADGKSVTVNEYWNPKNNPATWQHMVHYTIGYKDAARWPLLPSDPEFGTHTFDGDYARLWLGTKKWQNPVQPPIMQTTSGGFPSYYLNHGYTQQYPYEVFQEDVRAQEMWHAALNSRGKFVPAQTPADLVAAFRDLLSGIVADNNRQVSSYASSASSISTAGTAAFSSFYEANGWRGGVLSFTVAQNSAALQANPAWGLASNGTGLSTADKLDAWTEAEISNRLVLTHNDAQGSPFLYEQLSEAQKTLLSHPLANSSTTDALGPQRVLYIRGHRAQEGDTFRSRVSRQGDIVNSAVWYVGAPTQAYNLSGYNAFARKHRTRTPMLYVGGNDGMLHGFSARDGTEKIAYIPRGVLPYLPNLSHPSYSHRYLVDGSPFSGDVFFDAGTDSDEDRWHTMLVSSLGAGGKGFFVLDVTRPGSTDTAGVASNFTASNATNLVVMDKTDGTDPDIGHIFGEPVVNEYNAQVSPQITRLNNGRWAVVLGNGYNSGNERPVLLIQYLDGDRALLKLVAASTGAEASANGLSTPRLVDANGDGVPDVAYAGDLQGNLWKFSLSSANASNWGVAFSGTPLFTARYTTSAGAIQRQPITTAPLTRANTSTGGLMVAFGTGRNLTEADATDTTVQSFYAVLDATRYEVESTGSDKGKLKVLSITANSAVTAGRASLVARNFQSTAMAGTGSSTGLDFWSLNESSSPDYAQGGKGWYLDLPAAGERVLRSPHFYAAGSKVIEILSDKPQANGMGAQERCEPSPEQAKAWRTLLGIELGGRPNQQLLDRSGDGIYNAMSDGDANRMSTSPKQITLRTRGEQVHIGNQGTHRTSELLRPFTSINWRQMQ